MQSQSTQDYLKAIFSLSKPGQLVTTNSIADHLGIKSSSVTEMIGKLEKALLVSRVKYKGVRLTENGRQQAVWLIRKHRLWETFLVAKLGFGWDQVHEIAEQLEHVESPALIAKLDEFLSHPKFDPHGDPIPDSEGNIPEIMSVVMSEAKQGVYLISRILDDSQDLLGYLTKMEISINTLIQLISTETYDGSVNISIDGKEINLSRKVANNIMLVEAVR